MEDLSSRNEYRSRDPPRHMDRHIEWSLLLFSDLHKDIKNCDPTFTYIWKPPCCFFWHLIWHIPPLKYPLKTLSPHSTWNTIYAREYLICGRKRLWKGLWGSVHVFTIRKINILKGALYCNFDIFKYDIFHWKDHKEFILVQFFYDAPKWSFSVLKF